MLFVPVVELRETDLGTKKKARKALKDIMVNQPYIFNKEIGEYIQAVLEDAKRFCHVDTGALQASIRLAEMPKVPKTGSYKVARDVMLDYQIVAGGPPFYNPKHKRFVDYAAAHHDGTATTPPNPFITNAIAVNQPQFEEALKSYQDQVQRKFVADQPKGGAI